MLGIIARGVAAQRVTPRVAQYAPERNSTVLRDALLMATGERWQVERGTVEGASTLREQAEAAEAAEAERIRKHPLVEAAFEAFPGAEFVEEDDAPRGDRNWSKRA